MAWDKIHALQMAFFCLAASLCPVSANEALWKNHVEPLLKEHCQQCHSPPKTKSGLDLTSLQSMLRGGERGPAIVPGHPEASNLYKFVRSDSDPHMPPGTRKPLSEEEIALVGKWIQELPVIAATTGDTNGTGTNGAAVAAARPPNRIKWTPPSGMAAEKAVDHFLELAWKLDGITPAKLADDRVFVRRVWLDLAGRVPTREEADAFVKDHGADKRARLIDRLLAGADYARHMREVFDTVLMGRRGGSWEERRANEKWFAFLEDAFGRNRPWNEVVRDMIVARPQKPEDRGAVWFLYERENNPQAMAEAIAPVVFGVQVKCAQCHDHMIAREIKQAHYWGMVAAFNRSKNVDSPNGPRLTESATGGFVSFANLKKESQPAVLTFFNGRTVDEARPKDGEKETDSPELYLVPPAKEKNAKQAAVPKFSRRAAFADAVTRDNPLLARAMVNRMWALVFGRGLVHPVDLMDSKHAPSQPELLDWLAGDFERGGYDVKRLLRTLCNTRAYQLEDKPATGRKGQPPGPETFARALEKPLSAEQLFQSLLTVTGNAPDKDGKIAGRTEKELRAAFVAQFPDLFPAEYNATLQQALFLANSPLLDNLLTPRDGNLAERVAAQPSPEARVREAFAAVHGREPARDELRECVKYLSARPAQAGAQQLLWAMLSGAEFQLNH